MVLRLFLKTFWLPPLISSMEARFGFTDGRYRRDAAKLPYLLVVPIAVAIRSAFHRGRYAALNLAGGPFFRSAYNFLNVFYLSVLTHLRVVPHAVTLAISFGFA